MSFILLTSDDEQQITASALIVFDDDTASGVSLVGSLLPMGVSATFVEIGIVADVSN